MHKTHLLLTVALTWLMLTGQVFADSVTSDAQALAVPIEYYRLDNGLRVVLARNTSVPTVTVATYYHIGFRLEPMNRTGFAHLFEHLMFQETTHLKKGDADQLISGNGGASNGSTRFDYTNYYEVVPSHVLEPVLWIEAERMRGLAVSPASLQNQKDVVKNEVRVNVLNRPYGGFPWLSLPQVANQNWFNAHNFYGDLSDIDAATFADAQAFYDTYYVPANAVLVVAGDFEPSETRAMIAQQFSAIANKPEPTRPDISEPTQQTERVVQQTDANAPRPALAWGYHAPPRNSADWYAFVLLDSLLLGGQEGRLWQRLVKERGYADSIDGGLNSLGNEFNYEGPTLWSAYLIHDANASNKAITRDFDTVIAEIQKNPVTAQELNRARTRIRSSLYDLVGSSTRFGLVDLLACLALFDNNPDRINHIEESFSSVTPRDVMRVAKQYLTASNRTELILTAGRPPAGATP
jgi:predicted Zn-dependent peptidase